MSFVELATQPLILSVVKKFLGDFFILNLQNAIINRPNETHTKVHGIATCHTRIGSYPDHWRSTRFWPSMVSEMTGGTRVVPFSHKTEILPSDAYIAGDNVVAAATAGSAIFLTQCCSIELA